MRDTKEKKKKKKSFSCVGPVTKWGGLGLPRPPHGYAPGTVCFVYLLRDSSAWIVSKRELDSLPFSNGRHAQTLDTRRDARNIGWSFESLIAGL